MLDLRLHFSPPLAARIHEFGQRVAERFRVGGTRIGVLGAIDPVVIQFTQIRRAQCGRGARRHELRREVDRRIAQCIRPQELQPVLCRFNAPRRFSHSLRAQLLFTRRAERR